MKERLYPEPGKCPVCGTDLHMLFADWKDDSAPYGLRGGVRWTCRECNAPEYPSEWAKSVRRARVSAQIQLANLAALIGSTAAELSDIETGRKRPTILQRMRLTEWLTQQEPR